MAMLPLADRAFVEKRRWLTAQEMADVVAVMQSLPGLIAVNMAVLVGYRVKGVAGALVAAFASVLSPFLIIVAAAAGFSSLADSPTLGHVFLGIRAGTAALILISLVRLAEKVMDGRASWALGAVAFLAGVVFRVDATWIVLFGFLVGVGLVVVRALKEARA